MKMNRITHWNCSFFIRVLGRILSKIQNQQSLTRGPLVVGIEVKHHVLWELSVDRVGHQWLGSNPLTFLRKVMWFLNRVTFLAFRLWWTFGSRTAVLAVHVFREDISRFTKVDDNDSGSWIFYSQLFGSIRNRFSFLDDLMDEILPPLHHKSPTFVEIFALCFFLYKNLISTFWNYYGRVGCGSLFIILVNLGKLLYHRALIIIILRGNTIKL